MELKGRALFNLLRINWLDNPKIAVKPWQVEDLRGVGMETLFSRLKKLRLILNEESFNLYAENCESPEDLLDLVCGEEEDPEKKDQVYLILFELWRRLFPDQNCLSIFCDELDQLIEAYDKEELESDDALQSALQILEDILDQAFDKEGDPQKIFADVSSYLAHDLEGFLFDYITDKIQEDDQTYASELIDDFRDYLSDKRKLDVLRARLVALFDLEESNILYSRILEDLREKPDLPLNLLAAESLIRHGDVRLFMQAVKQALPTLATEEEFQNLLAMIAEYFRCLDRDAEEKKIKKFIEARSTHSLRAALDPKDQTLEQITQLVSRHSL